jgi:general secretion pathway protein J
VVRTQRGFTLLEVLASIVLLSLLLLGVYAGLRSITQASTAGTRVTQRLDEIRAAQQFIRHELTLTVPMPWARGPDGKVVVFQGGPEGFSYVAPLPGYLGRTGLQWQSFRAILTKDSGRLEVGFAPLPSRRAASFSPSDPEVILQGVRSATFLYAGNDAEGHATGWQTHWSFTDRLPAMVAVEIHLDGPLAWPRMEVPLRIDAAAVVQNEALARLAPRQ